MKHYFLLQFVVSRTQVAMYSQSDQIHGMPIPVADAPFSGPGIDCFEKATIDAVQINQSGSRAQINVLVRGELGPDAVLDQVHEHLSKSGWTRV